MLNEHCAQARLAGAVADKSETQFRRLLEKLPAGAYTCEPTGLITYFNPQAVALWGRAPKLHDPVDRYCGSFRLFATDGSPIDHGQCWMALTLKMNQGFNGREIVIERPDGQRLTVLAYANPIHDEAGGLLGAVNVLVDISARKRAENALKEADRSKNEFIAMLAHELRNPLAPIRNAVQILHLRGQPSPELQWALGVIERQMRQMTRLIDDLLDLARITGNKLDLCRERVDLEAILRVALETSQPLVEAGGQQLDVTFPPQPIFLDADLTRLSQVISNLLNNAVKYTARGGRIWLRAGQQGNDAVVSVGDTGMGIRADLLPRVFEMFAQGDRPSGRSPGGLGIGLTLARRLVEMHGGTITAHSDGPGKGSEFIVRLPTVAAPAPAQCPTAETRDAVPAFSFRILVVDDNQDAAASLSLLLQIMGSDVRVAHDGLEAVAMAEEFRPGLILLDIGLPGIDGYEAAQRIRRQDWSRDMVLVAVTGWGQQADRHRSRAAGFDYHLVKPVEPDALTQLLEQATTAASRPGA